MNENIKVIEEALLNSIPAQQTILLDGWILRLNQNYTYRANCVCPLNYTNDINVAEKIKTCEELFYRNKLPSVFKVTPVLQENLSDILLSLNYQNVKTVNVMRFALDDSIKDLKSEVNYSEIPGEEWLTASAKLTGITSPDLISVHCLGFKNIAVRSVFVKAVRNGKIVGIGYGTVERGYIGIYDLHVDSNYRKQGLGTAICNTIINYGKEHHAKYAYLIVHSKNKNAIALYSHMGFSKLYEYSFYQEANSSYQTIDA
jgi:N-acetylglutamate synthase